MNIPRVLRGEIRQDVKRAEHLGRMAKQKEAKEKKDDNRASNS